MKKCERCRALPSGPMGLLDYCGKCSRDLCDACMLVGCCGVVPAVSGMDEDFAEGDERDAEDEDTTREIDRQLSGRWEK